MSAWQWWTAVGVLLFVGCGGSSLRKDGGGGDAGSPDGGTSGAAGSSAGSGGDSRGGAPTGGRGGSGTSGEGGGASGRGGNAGGGSDGGDDSGGAGAGGEPSCSPGPSLNECSRTATCELFACGEPWSLYDAEGCARVHCTEDGRCPSGERCVPAPVLGRYDDPCFHQPDSCEPAEGSCSCSVWEECAPLALCVPSEEFPPERDCTFVGTDCAALTRAVATLRAYRDGTPFVFPYEPPESLGASVEACATELADLLQATCD